MNFFSIHIKNVQNGLRIQLACRFWCVLLLNSKVDSNKLFCASTLAIPQPVLKDPFLNRDYESGIKGPGSSNQD
jgi:hypothetical protein